MDLEHFAKLAELNTDICNMVCQMDKCTGKFEYSYYLPVPKAQEDIIKAILKNKIIVPTGLRRDVQFRGPNYYCVITHHKKNTFNFCFHSNPTKEWDGIIRGNPL